jgi:hypothetical protein
MEFCVTTQTSLAGLPQDLSRYDLSSGMENTSPIKNTIKKICNFFIAVWHFVTCGFFKSEKSQPRAIEISNKLAENNLLSPVSSCIQPNIDDPFRVSENCLASIEVANSESSCAQAVIDNSSKSPFIEFFKSIPEDERKFTRKFLFSNELNQEKTLEYLKTEKSFGDTFVGTGCYFTLNAFSIRPQKVDHLIVIDISVGVQNFWKTIEKIALNSRNSIEALQGLITEFPSHSKEEFLYANSWISSDDQFIKVKKLFSEGKFVFLRCDILNSGNSSLIGEALKRSNKEIDTIYHSNIGSCSYTFQKSAGWFLSSSLKQFLVRPSIHCMPKQYIEIYCEGGGGSHVPQQFSISEIQE